MRLTFFLNITRPARCRLEACYRVRVRVPRYGNYGHRRAPVEHGANMRAQTLASASLMVDHDAVALSEAQGLVNRVRNRVEGPWLGLSDEGLQLGEDLLDRIEVGRIFGEEEEVGAGGSDRVAHGLAFVRAEIVGHDDIVWLEGRDQELRDVGEEALAVDRAVKETRRLDPIAPQSGQERRGFPVSVRDLVDQSAPARRPAVKAGHVGLGPGLVDEDEPRRIDELLILAPSDPVALYVRTVLLAGDEGLFLGVKPMRRRNRLINEVSALTPRSPNNRSHSA